MPSVSEATRQREPDDHRQEHRDRPLLWLTLFAVLASLAVAAPFLPALAWAMTLAIMGQPLQTLLARRLRRPGARAGCTIAVLAALVAVPIVGAVPPIASEVGDAWTELRSESVQSRVEELVKAHPQLAQPVDWLRRHAPPMQDVAERVASHMPELMSASVWVALQWLVAFFGAFYFLRDRDAILGWLGRTLPLNATHFKRLQRRTAQVVEASVIGTLAVAAVQGTLGGLMFWMLGLPAPLLWGVVMALLSALPVMGAALVWIPAALLLALEGSWPKALVLIAWGGIVVGLVDNLLYPMLVGRKLRLHTLAVFVALVGGLLILGASGLVLGPLALALAVELLALRRGDAELHPEDA